MENSWLSYLNVEYLDNKIREIEKSKDIVLAKIADFLESNEDIMPDLWLYDISNGESLLGHSYEKDKGFDYKSNGYKVATIDPKIFYEPFEDIERGKKKEPNDKILNVKEELLKKSYCGNLSMQASHIDCDEEKEWLFSNFENLSFYIKTEERKRLFTKLCEVELFERFLHFRFAGAKRFSIEGLETVFAIFEGIIRGVFSNDLEECIFALAHRGRIAFLPNVLLHPYENIISEFLIDTFNIREKNIFGDVKYHIGGKRIIESPSVSDRSICLQLIPNPSHLESVFPVALGKSFYKYEKLGNAVLPIICHGDSALCGQGIVYESFGISNISGYSCGGSIHIAMNNGIGFTTMPEEYSSMSMPTDIAKSFNIPVFHLNAFDTEAAYIVSGLAMKYRKRFKKDVMINCVGYRKYGHNEGDEPTYTQPVLYRKISKLPSIVEEYEKNLIYEGILTEDEVNDIKNNIKTKIERAEKRACINKTYFYQVNNFSNKRENFIKNEKTGIAKNNFKLFAALMSSFPKNFKKNPKLEKFLSQRIAMLLGEKLIDWGTAEFAALASIINEGVSIRFTGQDAIRGTFAHRHACFFDYETGQKFCPIASLESGNAKFNILNSPLSEYGALGFEYGYSTECIGNSLCIWEAQFGDFANGAQIIIDQFIVSGFAKWGQRSNLVVLLPHGYEGQGPDHSSGRIERFLQMCAEDNILIVNCSLPSNFFHALRRQVSSKVPLIAFTPKSMLRSKFCLSSLEEFLLGKRFLTVIDERDKTINKELVETIILCSGKIYYDLCLKRKSRKAFKVAILTLEQLYPMPEQELYELLSSYTALKKIIWCQEEPKNMGAWNYIFIKFYESKMLLSDFFDKLNYVGRENSPTSATGYSCIHDAESDDIFNSVFLDK